ncbi:hypothetical protein PSN45_002336 [Yamadazyma tenuis]|uniref:SAP domain-containing protein n=1 Tax=Candida tenuis (strain ATCC 10573 / BCRC 21748 / CBS 615 / JCM 9827 / NBRC 10315 / NRRL Y-1498 / VKM Y-70) TaxID=590646 RepID=G3BEN9_CANTC|nr:uncharacterized protein CANTEDRAFT_110409 [Yamadazyma tenuis ATCC 10573]EGV59940.1 hypothetical protein CANTEDRAFT_110409 [Yamadazyma tenuis ATCC 10573]WEJ94836.1 hypothetical protein PSN45_002336 [Yamadazyma tenuis]
MSDYIANTVPQLKELLKARGLPLDGKKADLIARLSESDGVAEAPAEPQPEIEATPAEPKPKDPSPVAEGETAVSAPAATEAVVEKPKVLTPEERKSLAVDLLTKKIKRAEKFGDEASAEASRKDLARIEKFGVEPGTTLAKEIGLVDKSFNSGLAERSFKKKKNTKFKKFNRRN